MTGALTDRRYQPRPALSRGKRPLPREELEHFLVLLGGLREHVRRQARRGMLLVPGLGLQPVAHDLLVERRRAHADLVLGRGPEARRVRREDLVYQVELARAVHPELELG